MQINSEFAAACAILGISAREVSVALDVPHDTARSWITGRRAPRPRRGPRSRKCIRRALRRLKVSSG
jgi:hypothetical protein